MRIIEIFKNKPREIISIDFGRTSLQIAFLKSSRHTLELLNYDYKEISFAQETIPEIINFINNFLKTNSITSNEACISIAEPEYLVIKYLTLPMVPKEEIAGAIKWQLKTEVPFDLEKTMVDWQIVREFSDEEGTKKIGIICIVAAREAIDRYLSIMSSCHLLPARITSSYFNYANIINCLQEQSPTIAILDIGRKQAAISIYRNNKLNFIRDLVASLDKLMQSLSGSLISEKDKGEISYEKIKEIIRELGIPKEENLVPKDNIQAIQVISLMRPILEGLVVDLKRSFDYFSFNFKEEKISLLYITGAGANLKNLDWYLNKELNLEVKPLPLPQCIKTERVNREILDSNLNQIMSLLGAAMTGPGNINLLPAEMRTRKIELLEKISLRVIGIILGVICLFSLFVLKFQEGNYKKRLRNAQIHLGTIMEIKTLKEKIDLRQNLIDRIQKNRMPVPGLLRLISNLIPNAIILNELSLDLQQNSLILKGVVLSRGETAEDILTEFMKKAEATSFISEANLLESKNIGGVQLFEIKCDLTR